MRENTKKMRGEGKGCKTEAHKHSCECSGEGARTDMKEGSRQTGREREREIRRFRSGV